MFDHDGPIYSIARGARVVVIIVSILRGVAALVVGRDTREGIIAPVDAHPTLEVLLHLWLGARATSKVSVAPNWRERRIASGEVVFGQRREAASSVVCTSAGGVLTVAAGEAANVFVAGMERRRVGGDSAVRREAAVVHRRLPVNGLEAVLELGRGTELPFADYGPNDSTTSNRRGKYDDDGQGGVRQTRATNGSIVGRRRGGSRRDVAGQRYRIDRGRWLTDDGRLVSGRCRIWSILSRSRSGSRRGRRGGGRRGRTR